MNHIIFTKLHNLGDKWIQEANNIADSKTSDTAQIKRGFTLCECAKELNIALSEVLLVGEK